MSFAPKLSVLPASQRELWPALKEVPRNFVLYGGTALALRLAHRQSEDFDFFANAPIDPDELLNTLSFLKGAVVRQKSKNTLTVMATRSASVKLSFFGLRLRRVEDPEWTDDGIASVASLLDVAGCKMAVIQSRSEAKDYLDIAALLKHGLTLPEMLGAAQAIYGEQFFPMISLKALAWFGDGDLSRLPDAVKDTLSRAAAGVREIPEFKAQPGGITPAAT
jgi:nucleotidyltransferase AbiEii toxin of type IV toxin-antitoxin system